MWNTEGDGLICLKSIFITKMKKFPTYCGKPVHSFLVKQQTTTATTANYQTCKTNGRQTDPTLLSVSRWWFDPVWQAGEDTVLCINYALQGSTHGQAVLSGLFNPGVAACDSVQSRVKHNIFKICIITELTYRYLKCVIKCIYEEPTRSRRWRGEKKYVT